MKVAFLNPNIPPRAVSLLNRINANKNVSIHAVFYAVSQKNRKWSLDSKEYEKIQFPFTILKSIDISFGVKDFHNTFLSFEIFKVLKIINPDIIVLPGWSDITSLLALAWAKFHNVKVILRTESTAKEKSWRRTVFFPITLASIALSDLIVGSSDAAQKYASSVYSITPATTILSSFDTVSFAKKVNKERNKKERNKKLLNINQKKVVYFNGQLIHRKGIHQLLEAFTSSELNKIALMITGSGNNEQIIKAFAKEHHNIYYFGYATQDQLPTFYSLADIFILPSFEETWGLVVVEALASGLPVITSQFVGASEIITNDRGNVIDTVNPSSIISAVTKILKKNYKTIGKNNQEFALNKLNYEKTAKEFTDVFKKLSKA